MLEKFDSVSTKFELKLLHFLKILLNLFKFSIPSLSLRHMSSVAINFKGHATSHWKGTSSGSARIHFEISLISHRWLDGDFVAIGNMPNKALFLLTRRELPKCKATLSNLGNLFSGGRRSATCRWWFSEIYTRNAHLKVATETIT